MTEGSKFWRLWLCLLSYWLLALPTALKTLGGYILGRELGNELIENGFYWLRLVKQLWVGSVPLWAPQVHAGYPIVGNAKLALLHPFTLWCVAFEPATVLNLLMFAAAPLSATGMWLYCRRLGLSRFSGWLAGLIFGFHPYYAGQVFVFGNWSFLLAYWTLPYCLWACFGLCKNATWRDVGVSALFFGLVLYSQHIPLFLLVLLLVTAQTVILSYTHCAFIPSMTKLLAALFLALLLGAPTLLPLYHFIQQTGNSIPIDNARDYPLARLLPEHFVSALFPRFFGDEINSVYWGRLSYSSTVIYSGVVTVILWFLALGYRCRRKLVLATLAGFVICLFLSSELLPVYGILCLLPGWLQWTVAPSFFLFLFPFFASLSGALGWEAIMERPVTWRRRTGHVLLILTVLAAGLGWLYFGRSGGGLLWKSLVLSITSDPLSSLPPELINRIQGSEKFFGACFDVAYGSVVWSLLFLGCFALILIFGFARDARPRAGTLAIFGLLMAADVVAFYHSLESIFPTSLLNFPKNAGEYLAEKCSRDYRCLAPLDPDLCMAPAQYGVRNAWVRTPFVYKDYHDLVRVQERLASYYAPGLMMTRLTPLTRAMGVRTLVTRPQNVFREDSTTVTLQTNLVWVYETTNTLRRAFFPRKIVETTQSMVALFNVASLDWHPEDVAYVDASSLRVPKELYQPEDTTVSVIEENGRGLRITLSEATTATSILILSDIYDPWWKAKAGSTEIPVGKANYAFRALLLPPKTQEVTLFYNVPNLTFLYALTLLGIVLIISLLLIRTPQRYDKS
ncbi:MAG: hypothetical protein ACP5UB_08080 [Candidatus Sumerlaeaceae bacterium]